MTSPPDAPEKPAPEMGTEEKTSDELKTFKAGEAIFTEGDNSGDLFLIKEGRVEIFLERQGNRITLAQLSAGRIFGTLATLANAARSASAKAVDDVTLVTISAKKLQTSLDEVPVWLKVLIKDLIFSINEINSEYVKVCLRLKKFDKSKE